MKNITSEKNFASKVLEYTLKGLFSEKLNKNPCILNKENFEIVLITKNKKIKKSFNFNINNTQSYPYEVIMNFYKDIKKYTYVNINYKIEYIAKF
jgi:hypothetical protein